TGVVDPTGRHLAMMPHPERTHRKQHFHYWPREWEAIQNSAWLRMMHNYRLHCEQTEDLSIMPPRELYEGMRKR
ncbi:MAG: phosphoribosylformylglycinamidine synthase subunit PurQ, partial [bacterium]